jgi:hypothetical protein
MPSTRVLIVLALLCCAGLTLTFTGHPVIGGLLIAKSVALFRIARVMPRVLAFMGPPPSRRARS